VHNAVAPLAVFRPRRREVASPQASIQPEWLDISRVARFEVSSQHGRHPIADAFSSTGDGWRASERGEQVIRVLFRSPRIVGRIRVAFTEAEVDRTQEFTLSWSSHRGETHHQIVRQRFSFSRFGGARTVEEYHVELHDVTGLELRIVPDIERGQALASLAEFKIA
jgi:uncharacterized protein (DUF736 family)